MDSFDRPFGQSRPTLTLMPFWSFSGKPPTRLRPGQQIPAEKYERWVRYRLDELVRNRPPHLRDRPVEFAFLGWSPWRDEGQFQYPWEERLVVVYDDRITGHRCVDVTRPVGPDDSEFFIERADLTDVALLTDRDTKSDLLGNRLLVSEAANRPVLVLRSRNQVQSDPRGDRGLDTSPIGTVLPLMTTSTKDTEMLLAFARALGAQAT